LPVSVRGPVELLGICPIDGGLIHSGAISVLVGGTVDRAVENEHWKCC